MSIRKGLYNQPAEHNTLNMIKPRKNLEKQNSVMVHLNKYIL